MSLLNTIHRVLQRNEEIFLSFDKIREKANHDNFSVELRKKKRFKYCSIKRGNLQEKCEEVPKEILYLIPKESESLDTKLRKYIDILKSYDSDLAIKTYCVSSCRKLFVSKSNSGVFIGLGLVEIALSNLASNDFELLNQSTWLLVNISAGKPEYSTIMMKKGVVEACLSLITRKLPEISDNCLRCLANMTVENTEVSEFLLKISFLEFIYNLLQSPNYSCNPWAYWTLAHISKYIKSTKDIQSLMDMFIQGLLTTTDITKPCLSGIFILTVNSLDKTNYLLKYNGIVNKIIELSYNSDPDISHRSIKILGNISGTTNENSQILLDADILDRIHAGIKTENHVIKKESYFILSNLLAGNSFQFNYIMSHSFLIKDALEGTINKSFDVRMEAWHAFWNISGNSNPLRFQVFEELPAYIKLSLTQNCDPKILVLVIQTFEKILSNSQEKIEYFKKILMDTGTVEELAKKKDHGNNQISDIVTEIIDTYYDFNELHGIPDDEKLLVPGLSYSFS
jgi:importin subunit alpha-6/7